MSELDSGTVVEQGRRLSESMLWRLQRDFYDDRGISAWSKGNVPQTITTTPHIARAYAKIALGYLRDMAAQLDAAQPVYIVELGAGSGRFAYRFVKRLASLLERSALSHTSFIYVMTDASTTMIDYWQAHPMLRPLVEAGLVDFAHYDTTQRADIKPINSNVTLAGSLANPMIVVANYVFDSIPHDCFSIRDGQLFENRVRVISPHSEPVQSPELPRVGDLAVSFEAHPTSQDYYPEAALNRILDGYRRRLSDIMLLFPVSAMACVRHFHELSAQRALFLVSDVGSTREGDLGTHGTGGIGKDGYFWLEVNFHALGQYVDELGGRALHPPHRHSALNVSAFILGDSPTGFGETALAYEDAIAQGGPDDFFMLTRVIATSFASMRRDDVLAFLRSTGWDSEYFVECLPFLLQSLQRASPSTRQDLYSAIEEAWDVYYPIGGGGDLGFACGALLFRMEDYPRALEYFHHSLQLVGQDSNTTFNIALCLYRLGRSAEAVEWLDRTLELDPASEPAQGMRAALVEEEFHADT